MDNYAEQTICWNCRHAVPKAIENKKTGDVRYIRGCPWSIYKQPVPGWNAEERQLPGHNGIDLRSFWVKHCPMFERGRK